METIEEAVLYARPSEEDGNPLKAPCVVFRIRNEQNLDSILEQVSVRRLPDGRLESTRTDSTLNGVWIAGPRVLMTCVKPDLLDAALRTGRGEAPSFANSKHYRKGIDNQTWAYANLHQLTHGTKRGLEAGSHVFATLPDNAPAMIDLSFSGRGDGYPRVAEMIETIDHGFLAQFPRGAAAMVSLSLERTKGKTLEDAVNELVKFGNHGAPEEFRSTLVDLGIDLQTLDRVVGPEIALAVYADPKFKTTAENFLTHKGALIALPTKNEDEAKKAWQSILSALKKKKTKQKVTFAGESVTVEMGGADQWRAERKKGLILVTIGDKKYTSELAGQFGSAKDSYAGNADFEAARKAQKPSHLLGYVSLASLTSIFNVPFGENLFAQPQVASELLTLTLAPAERGLDVNLHSPISTVGMASAVAIYGVNRYLKSAKTAEAKNTILSISRAAMFAYERESETGQHALCKSAIAVPAAVPKAMKYMPSDQKGRDFFSGDSTTGWNCLKFSVNSPMYYQYDYRVGGNYKGPARGGPDPGPNGFEASAEGDLDGDGKTSLFTLVGQVKDGTIQRATQIFIADEME